ncbi:hypothetical protein B4Q04_20135 [Zobellia sp. OII3]|nr:hypothetical protein B4Q04_20135 [Zobellia sp. OII3]
MMAFPIGRTSGHFPKAREFVYSGNVPIKLVRGAGGTWTCQFYRNDSQAAIERPARVSFFCYWFGVFPWVRAQRWKGGYFA